MDTAKQQNFDFLFRIYKCLGAVSSRVLQVQLPKDLLIQVAALNTIKTILDERNMFSYNDFLIKYKKQNGLGVLVDEVATMLTSPVPLEYRNKFRNYFLNIMISSDADIETIRKANLFSNEELQDIKKQRNGAEMALPPVAATTDWRIGDLKSVFKRFSISILLMVTFSFKLQILDWKLAQ